MVLTARFNTFVDGVDAAMSAVYALRRRDLGVGPKVVTAFAGVVTTQWVRFARHVAAYEAAQAGGH